MRPGLKFIMAFLFLMLTSGIKTDALSTSVMSQISFAVIHSELSEDSSPNEDGYNVSSSWYRVSAIESSSTSFMDVMNMEHHFHLRRITELSTSFKNAMYKLCLIREDIFTLDKSKFYYSNKTPHYVQTCSEYYIFALRRILI